MTCWEKCGTTWGRFIVALKAIADQEHKGDFVVRVAENTKKKTERRRINWLSVVLNLTVPLGCMRCHAAEQDESTGYRPRILGRAGAGLEVEQNPV